MKKSFRRWELRFEKRTKGEMILKIQQQQPKYEFAKELPNQKKKKKRRFRPLKFLFTLVLLMVALVFLVLSPLFNITKIEMRGSKQYSQEEIISVTNLALGNNAFKMMGNNISSILRLRYLSDESRIKNHFPYIKDASVKYIIPSKVILNLSEREPKYLVLKDSEVFLMDGEGILVDKVEDLKNLTLPVINGLNFEKFEVGQALKPKDLERLNYVSKLKNALLESDKDDTFKLSDIVSYFDVSDMRKISVMVDSKILINFGDLQDLNYRIRFAKYLYSKSIGKQDRGSLDFSSGDNPRFIPEN